jgi:hypothetical protein
MLFYRPQITSTNVAYFTQVPRLKDNLTIIATFFDSSYRAILRLSSKKRYIQLTMLYIIQLQDWNVECQNFESRRQIGKFEKRNAEERGVYSRCQ